MPNEAAKQMFERVSNIMANAQDVSALSQLINCIEPKKLLARDLVGDAIEYAIEFEPDLPTALWLACQEMFTELSAPVPYYVDNMWALQCAMFGYILRYQNLDFVTKEPLPFLKIALNPHVNWGMYQTPASLDRLIPLAQKLRVNSEMQADIDAFEERIQLAIKEIIAEFTPTCTTTLEQLEDFLQSLYQQSSCFRMFDFHKTLFWFAISQLCAKYQQPIEYENSPEILYKLIDIVAIAHRPAIIADRDLKRFEDSLQAALINNIETLSCEETGRLNPFREFLKKLQNSNMLSFQRQIFAAIVDKVKQLSTRDKTILDRLGIQTSGGSLSVHVAMLFRSPQVKVNGLQVSAAAQNGNHKMISLRHSNV